MPQAETMADPKMCGRETACFRPLPTIKGKVDILRDTERIAYRLRDGPPCVRCGLGHRDVLRMSRTLPVRHGDIVAVVPPGVPVSRIVRYTERADGLIALWKHTPDPWIVRPGACTFFRILDRVPVSADVMVWINRLPLWRTPAYLCVGTDPLEQALQKLKREALGVMSQPPPEATAIGMDALWSYVQLRRRPGRVLNLEARLSIKSNRQINKESHSTPDER